MIKEAIEKIEAMAMPLVQEIDDHFYLLTKNEGYQEIRPELDVPNPEKLKSLDALVQLIRKEAYDWILKIFVSVESATRVRVFTGAGVDYRMDRLLLYIADAADIPGWDAEVRLPFDQAAVALMTRFQDSPDREYALRLLSQITMGAKVTYADNGIATTIVTQKGAALSENSVIKPLVRLRPYRTFQEVEQPEGVFLIRIDERGITFTEADGGMWRLNARNTVKAWLTEQLQGLDNVTVML